MGTWFEGSIQIDCDLQKVRDAMKDQGRFHQGVTAHMPGISSAQLVDDASDTVTIKTNEGLMERSAIQVVTDGQVVLVFDEAYHAGVVHTTTHFRQEFRASDAGVEFRLIMSDVRSPGVLGFLYRVFARRSIGNGLLRSTKAFLEDG